MVDYPIVENPYSTVRRALKNNKRLDLESYSPDDNVNTTSANNTPTQLTEIFNSLKEDIPLFSEASNFNNITKSVSILFCHELNYYILKVMLIINFEITYSFIFLLPRYLI